MNMKKLQQQALELCDQGLAFVTMAEHQGGLFDIDETQPYELAIELETWYASAAQIMAATGFRGIERFERLYEDSSFSMPEYIRQGSYDAEESLGTDEYVDLIRRLWQMYFILKSLPHAIAAASDDEVRGIGAVDIINYLRGAVDRLSEESVREVGPGVRSHVEEAVALALARHGLTVVRRQDRVRACFADKVEALQNAGRITGSEREGLVRTYSAFSATAHPAQPEPVGRLKEMLTSALSIIQRKLLANPANQ